MTLAPKHRWLLDPSIAFLNHGSFGACPIVVLEAAQRIREKIERQPIRVLIGELEGLLDEARRAVAAFVGADADGVAFVQNATSGVSTVLRSLTFAPGDELLTTDHAYNACRNALDRAGATAGARVVVAEVPFPTPSSAAVVEAVLAKVTPRTRIALLDHVTSPTAIVFPIDELVAELDARGVDTIVDAAHAPGMVPLRLTETGAAYTTGNFHKWLCAPKGAAFLYVREDRRAAIHPLVTSHGANSPRRDRSRFRLEFDWTGTCDPAPFLCVPEAIRFLDGLAPGGVRTWMDRNRAAAIEARGTLCTALGIEPPCPDDMLGSMASVPLPDRPVPRVEGRGGPFDPLQDALYSRFAIEVPIFPFPAPPHRMVRVSTPMYVEHAEIERLAAALIELGFGA